MQARASRTEPLGLDRYHRRYWWLRSGPGAVFVENPDGKGPMGAIRTKEQLDEVGQLVLEIRIQFGCNLDAI